MKPITRANFAIGAEKEKQYGYRINEKCIGCGLCTSKCPQNCIDTLSIPFRIRENNCLHCGNCMEVCPNNAVKKTMLILLPAMWQMTIITDTKRTLEC